MSQVRLIWVTPDAEKLIAYIARVSSSNQDNPDYEKLIGYLIEHKHWSPFEMVSACFEIETSRAIGRQILRHRSFCVAEGTNITFNVPNKQNKGLNVAYRIPIERLCKQFHSWPDRYKRMFLRVYDTETKTFDVGHLIDVLNTGNNQCFKVVLADGKSITCTKEHQFLTSDGWKTLEDAVGLSISKGGIATMSKDCFVATNGEPFYQSKTWMKEQRSNKLMVQEIADLAQCSYHTIRKWLRIHGLQYTRKETAEIIKVKHGGPWNKGKRYKTGPKHTEEFKQRMRELRSGSKSNLWKGGVERSFRQRVWDFTTSISKEVHSSNNYICQMCFRRGGKLEVHHIKPVYSNPELAFDRSNLTTLCKGCHDKHHHINGDQKAWREKHKGSALTCKWVKIQSIENAGILPTYDLSVDHPSHNYVANSIVVHNSFQELSLRYTEVQSFEEIKPRKQAKKNRQSSTNDLDSDTECWFMAQYNELIAQANNFYTEAIYRGVARESARFVLPECATSRLYMAGTLRSWIHYLELRTKEDSQQEHREVAQSIKQELGLYFPTVFKVLGWSDESPICSERS